MKHNGVHWGTLVVLALGLVALGARLAKVRADDETPSSIAVAAARQPPRCDRKAPGIEELVKELAAIMARKGELEKAEKVTRAALQEKFEQLKEDMKRVGVDAESKVWVKSVDLKSEGDFADTIERPDPPELGPIADKDKKKINRVAILTYFNPLETRSAAIRIDRELAGVLTRLLKEQCEANEDKIDVISPRKVEEYKNTHPNWKQTDLPDIGRALKADYLIYIEINSISLYDKGASTFRGRANLAVTLVDVAKPDDDPLNQQNSYVYPSEARGDLAVDLDTTLEQFREQFVLYLAKRLSWCFTPHRKREGAFVE